ncbi:MAG: phage major capsid protein [Polyangiaceae bacterium]
MAVTTQANVVIPEILEGALRGVVAAGLSVMLGSGAAIFRTGFTKGKDDVGSEVTIPYFGSMGDFELLANDGDALTVQTFAQSSETAPVQHAGKAFEMTYLAQNGSAKGQDGEDIYDEGSRQLGEGYARVLDQALLTVAEDETGWLPYVEDATGVGTINYDLCVNTIGRLGDEGFQLEEMAAVVCHSKTFADLLKLKTPGGDPILMDKFSDGRRPRFLGLPIMVTDKVTVVPGTPNLYKTLFLKRGSLVAWVNENVTIDKDKDILTDTDAAATHMYFAAHRYSRLAGRSKPGVAILKHQ